MSNKKAIEQKDDLLSLNTPCKFRKIWNIVYLIKELRLLLCQNEHSCLCILRWATKKTNAEYFSRSCNFDPNFVRLFMVKSRFSRTNYQVSLFFLFIFLFDRLPFRVCPFESSLAAKCSSLFWFRFFFLLSFIKHLFNIITHGDKALDLQKRCARASKCHFLSLRTVRAIKELIFCERSHAMSDDTNNTNQMPMAFSTAQQLLFFTSFVLFFVFALKFHSFGWHRAGVLYT